MICDDNIKNSEKCSQKFWNFSINIPSTIPILKSLLFAKYLSFNNIRFNHLKLPFQISIYMILQHYNINKPII